MCIDTKWNYKKQKEWLKTKPSTITAYKVVEINEENHRIYPPILYSEGSYEKTNTIDKAFIPIVKVWNDGRVNKSYKAAYHLFLTKAGAEKWQKSVLQIILKCEISKKDVVAIGSQNNSMVIVTKEFTFVEGDEYF